MLGFLSSKTAKILTVVLLMQAMAFYGLARTEEVHIVKPLSSFPKEFNSWTLIQEGTVEKEVLDILKADDVLSRWYGDSKSRTMAALFIAYFNTQRTGKAPHSPKNCLPGSGWLPLSNPDQIEIKVPGHQPIEASRYIVARGNDKSLVIYWYQTARRSVGNEYKAKIFTVVDAVRYNRSDTALVKVTVPLKDQDPEAATEVVRQMVQSFFDQLIPYFPA